MGLKVAGEASLVKEDSPTTGTEEGRGCTILAGGSSLRRLALNFLFCYLDPSLFSCLWCCGDSAAPGRAVTSKHLQTV